MDSESALRQAQIDELVKAEKVRLCVQQVRRIPIALFVLDACIAWTAWRVGLLQFSLAWCAVIVVTQVARILHVNHLTRRAATAPETMLTILAAWSLVLGLLHAVLVIRVFQTPVAQAHYVLTMVLVGTAAGAVASVGGEVRNYALWSVFFGGSLAGSWLATGTLEGAAIALLLLLLFTVLTMFVRDQGRTLETLVTLTDSLRRERDRAERASAAKTRFFAAASHDLRQPLTALAYNAATVQVLAADNGDETLTRVGAGIGRALAQARGLLDSLLEVSKLDAGVVQATIEPVDISALLIDVREAFAPSAAERGLELFCACDTATALYVDTDTAIVRRVVHNLVDNAIKFTASGSITVGAGQVPSPGTGMLRVYVRDSGPGIARDKQEQVFEEFCQLGNAERDRSKGLGLGLSIVRRLAALLGTQVRLTSKPGQGATFFFDLPCSAPRQLTAESIQTADPVADKSKVCRRALVIDDEPDIRDSLQTLLATQGWHAIAVADLAQAMEQLHDGFLPDALIVDFRLRDGASGLDALDAIRARGCAAPAWLITGDTEPTKIALARAAGLPVIYKPVDGMELVQSMESRLAAQAA